ncbi:DUF4123 domain-containing protein [Escherichia coli]|uniref:DUF4123 domain-containing protein n=1 Tax=Escherichia coli TaxID=562 RepID=UPI0017DCDA84|nr:DUF4123 domain-containing protein [Escherichia coli]EFG4857746.1 DUF4123 domain-containing protein [Escherichia coli]EFK2025061.1 DUF4123 domain-containing protein [Escherichia coli]EFK3609294.1 DUF4123 domain-containing protein [Escherichia coli]CAD5737779.1 Uncharacterised protein [Escherichia coli]HAW7935384.1 DUF4123 domain-containing protein [Escherichia coli]
MNTLLSLHQWRDITATTGMPLYAILSGVSDACPIREYYRHDGSHTPVGLYSATPYANWTEIMPVIVPLDEHSPFLKWVESTECKDWGWLARSPYIFERILAYLRGLVKVILPEGKEVFFRYWDGVWFAEHLRYMGDDWRDVMPPFAFYLVNGEDFTVRIHTKGEVKTSPWWRVPQGLIDAMMQKDCTPRVNNALKTLQELKPDIFTLCDETLLAARLRRIFATSVSTPDLGKLLHHLESDIHLHQ